MDYQYPAVGAIYDGEKTTFTVWAPEREHVQLVIGDSIHQMNRDERGFWTTTRDDAPPATQYKYLLDNKDSFPDPASRSQPLDVHGPSAVTGKTFPWTDHEWKGLSLGEMIIYELHVGTFTAQGTFEGIIARLDYLVDLGVNAIEIMPVAQFPGSRNWGYDGVYPFAAQHSYGGVEGLKKLVDAAHRKGIAIILDVVYNHQGPEGNYLAAFGPYFTEKYKTGWGKAINFDDASCDGVRHYYWQNALMWLGEFHIDGLRLDAVHAIWDNSANHFVDELRKKVAALEAETGQKKVLIAEFDLNNPRYVSHEAVGGFGLDGQWVDEFHHALHAVITGETDGYYEDFGSPDHLVRTLTNSYVYTGEFSVHRQKHFGKTVGNLPYDKFVVFAQNHDQIGNRMLGDRLAASLSFEQLKLTAAFYLLSPHVPMLFMGEEYGERNPFQYFISHTDKELVELIRKGRKEEFSYFKWEGELPDPQSPETFHNCKLSWDIEKDSIKQTLFSFYQYLISFRKNRPAMKNFSRDSISSPLLFDKTIVFERSSHNERLLFIFNVGKTPSYVPVSESAKKIFDSTDEKWNGGGSHNKGTTEGYEINPESALIFELTT